jgi:uncharacterized protein (DUF1778 family)
LADIPDHLRAKIEEAAPWKGMSVSTFVANAAAKEAELIIEKERLIQLSREDAELILTLVDDPPQPNTALQQAAKLHKRLVDG